MFFFNIENLEQEAEHDNKRFMFLLEKFYHKRLPRRQDKFKPAKLSLVGSSYLLNPEPLFKDPNDVAYLVQYVKLAGRRDYTMYKQYKYKGLLIDYFPDLELGNIKTNPLLEITKTEILFLYEENKEIK